MSEESQPISPRDYAFLVIFCAIFFGFTAFDRIPFSDAETIASQLSANGSPLFVGLLKLLSQGAVARIVSAVAGAIVVFLTARLSGKWFGRLIGLASGYVLATSCGFIKAASTVSPEAMLVLFTTLAIAFFVEGEWFADQRSFATRLHPVGPRAKTLIASFISIGCAGFVFGALTGALVVGSTLLVFLLINLRMDRFRRYAWLWGWLAAVGIGGVWVFYCSLTQDGAWEAYKDSLFGLQNPLSIGEPKWWRVALNLPIALLPWTPMALGGMLVTGGVALRPIIANDRPGAERFVWCWAIVPMLAFLAVPGNQQHLLIATLPAWAIITAFGCQRLMEVIRLKWHDVDGAIAMRNSVILIAIIYTVGRYWLPFLR